MKFFKLLSNIYTSIIESHQKQVAEAIRYGKYNRWE